MSAPTRMRLELKGGPKDGMLLDADLVTMSVFVHHASNAFALDGLVAGVKAEDQAAYGVTEQKCVNEECKGNGSRYAVFTPPAKAK